MIPDASVTNCKAMTSYVACLNTMCNVLHSIYLILAAALGPGVYSASTISEYQKQKNYVSVELSAAGA
jgi:hypothetical protein